jgi:predicted dienelactone hydrolase
MARVTMFFVRFPIHLLVILASINACAGQMPSRPYSVPLADAPELAARGRYSVGVRTIEIVHRNQIDILHFEKTAGKAPRYDRPLTIEIWYPALIAKAQNEQTIYKMPVPGRNRPADLPPFEIADQASRDATPVASTRFPLVIVSHGYPGSRYFLTYLTSNLASKGYVVAAIDHTDSVFGSIRGFESTLLNRASDQLFTIQALDRLARDSNHFLHGLIDTANVAIVGYSMGGYGALISAGAGLNSTSQLMQFVPGGYLHDWSADSDQYKNLDRSPIKAMVAIAPWGYQPPYRGWSAQGLAAIRIPSLFIAGDHDDVADYANGIKPAFEAAVQSERCMLVYENARHNTGADPAPANRILNYPLMQSTEEPVWRKDRINAINQHFITAFLDLYLKGDHDKAAYLHVEPSHSNDGKWVVQGPDNDTGTYSSGTDVAGNHFWKGFQRRWALGLEMYCSSAAGAM